MCIKTIIGYFPGPRNKPFTLIELLVVISIIAILASLLLPTLARARYTVKITVCSNNFKQVGLAYMSYSSDYADFYPYASRNDGEGCQYCTTSTWQGITHHDGRVFSHGGHWDRRPLLIPYFSGEEGMRKVNFCPLMEGLFPNNELGGALPFNRYHGTYNMYSHVISKDGIPNPGNASVAKNATVMRKVGDRWLAGQTNQYMNILGSEANGIGFGRILSNHGSFQDQGVPFNNNTHLQFARNHPNNYNANGHVLLDDGSVHITRGLLFPGTWKTSATGIGAAFRVPMEFGEAK